MKKTINKNTEEMSKHSSGETEQVFVFKLDGEEYAVEVKNVEEIIRAREKSVTTVPNVPDFIKGIINVRGQVVPLMDLEQKFDLENKESNFIIIVEIGDSSVGVLADDVEEVLRIDKSKIKEAPRVLQQEIHAEYIQQVAVLDDRMIIIIDIEEGLSNQEAVAMEDLGEEKEQTEEEEEEEITQEQVEEMAKKKVKQRSESKNTDASEEKDEDDSQDDESFECDVCGDTFDSKRGLASHKAQVH